MNKKFLFNTFLLAGAVMFAACDYNEDNFDGLEEGHVPTDVKKLEYTLTTADYKAVSTNKANMALAGDSLKKALGNVAKNEAFSDEIPASQFLPAFLASKYFTADNGSAIKVTYNKQLSWSDEMKALNSGSIYKVSNEDYENIWGAGFNFFSPVETAAKHVPAILKAKMDKAEAGDVVFVDYNVSDSEPAGAVVAMNEPFDGYWAEPTNTAEVTGWLNVTTKGKYTWNGKTFNDNNYLQASAFKHDEDLEIYMITPRISVMNGMNFSFDACYGHYMEEGGRISVLLLESTDDLSGYTAEQIAAAKWVDITEGLNIPVPEGMYGVLGNVYNKDLSEYAGKKVYIAFRYNGSAATKATTTVQVDNVVIKSEGSGEGENVVYPATGVFEYDGEAWSQNNKVVTLTKDDFKAMGGKYDNFSNSFKADNYLPQFLTIKYPYAQEGAEKTVVYKYHSKDSDDVRADEYVVVAGAWTKAPKTETVTDQFVLNNGKWNYDPSTVIELMPSKNETSVLYYQTATDWVWENIDLPLGAAKKGDAYVTSYGNNEYYSGCSAHYGNVDMRADKARGQYAKGYEGMTDEEVVAAMEKHLVEVMKGTLETLHKDVAPIEGIDVIFTVKMGVYTGIQLTDVNYEMKYKVTAPGTFEYVEDSYQPIVK